MFIFWIFICEYLFVNIYINLDSTFSIINNNLKNKKNDYIKIAARTNKNNEKSLQLAT